MKKKALLLILSILLIAVCTLAFVACNDNDANNNPSWGTVYTMDAAYARATDLGYAGSLEEFIALISGKDGVNGKDGKDGVDGKNGKDGQNGTNGVGIVSIELNDSGNLIISMTDNTIIDLENAFKCAHTYSTWEVVIQPTCTSVGCDVRTCTKCDNNEYKFYDELGHDWDDGEIVFEPTCNSKGLKIYACLSCDATKSEILDKQHNYVDGVCPACGKLETTEELLTFNLINNNSEYEVSLRVTCRPSATRVVIPETYNDLPVTRINDNAFMSCAELQSIYIPNSITEIGNNAFMNCPKLTNLEIPKSVTQIGIRIAVLTNLESITVDEENPVYHSAGNCIIETKSKTLILGCKNSIIPTDGSVIIIGERAFQSCEIANIVIPDCVIEIAEAAFCNSKLTSIIIPQSMSTIGTEAFWQCGKLKVVYNLSSLDIEIGSSTHGHVAYYAEELYTSLDEDANQEIA